MSNENGRATKDEATVGDEEINENKLGMCEPMRESRVVRWTNNVKWRNCKNS